MIDLLNRIGFRQIAFGGESSGGSGSGRTDGPDETLVTRGDSYAYDPYEDADLYDVTRQSILAQTMAAAAVAVAVVITIMMTMATTPTKMRAFTTIMATSKSILAQTMAATTTTTTMIVSQHLHLHLHLHLRLHQLPMTPTKMRAFMVMAATSKSILALITVEAATTL
jgi:hypothetical protein